MGSVPISEHENAGVYNIWKAAMSETAKKLSAQARKLSASERHELVDSILASLDEPDPKIDQLWLKEAEERLAAYRRGEIKAVSLQEALAKYRLK